MPSKESPPHTLADIAAETNAIFQGKLDWVGMAEIELPITLNREGVRFASRIGAYVNLNNAEARGIHMSRLYTHIDHILSNEPLTPSSLQRLLCRFIDSHATLSDCAKVQIRFDYLLRRAALVSDNSGWRAYPITITAQLVNTQFVLELEVEIAYSSTCPNSAALARQLIQERFNQDFIAEKPLEHNAVLNWLGHEKGMCATPHSQRSIANVHVTLNDCHDCHDFPIVALIETVESALKTPVQAAVKREDEQAFAKLNGNNLMFCEDAARRIQSALNKDECFTNFRIRVSHHESLHPHNAVAIVSQDKTKPYNQCDGNKAGSSRISNQLKPQ